MYPISVILTLVGMITAGAARIVVVKIYYQIELEESRPVTPLFVTLLYLVGQALSLLVHFVCVRFDYSKRERSDNGIGYDTIEMAAMKLDDDDDNNNEPFVAAVPPKAIEDEEQADRPAGTDATEETDTECGSGDGSDDETDVPGDEEGSECERAETGSDPRCGGSPLHAGGPVRVDPGDGLLLEGNSDGRRGHGKERPPPRGRMRRRGSKTGLTSDSREAVAWIHRIPWYLKPGIPGFFNLCNSALRWACLVYVAASTAEILISGLELVLSSFAARVLRKRIISRRRWIGVSVVTAGIVLVGFAKLEETRDSDSETHNFLVGNLLIVGQCVFSVLQDLSEEVFMQEANFPATLLLGMEGLFGLVFGLPIYALFFDEEISFTRFNIEYQIGLVVLVLLTGILNIRTTEATSSMTRNVWKQFRIMLVWILGLLVYYLGSGGRLGEAWVFPDSLFVLGGFGVILTGVFFYYSG
ncbi:unnamed protein product [Pseudo-nitzschia multistriata]|uniref:EamA domain-containing protein n=1 Tax=Pseudo-nitzschia multistriata TaxID=183589 RepID=A0A448Z0M1_9STRA|nr:unnamed protein product [Pseudo-nitzschia multistriata]